MWRIPSECGGGLAAHVLYLAGLMSWCSIAESKRFVPRTISRRCLSQTLVSSTVPWWRLRDVVDKLCDRSLSFDHETELRWVTSVVIVAPARASEV